MSMVETNLRALTVEAKDKDGNTVPLELKDPYADGSVMSSENNEVKVKTGKADFGTATVSISANSTLQNLTQKYGYVKMTQVNMGSWYDT